jgi:hypothetical protein
MWNFEDQNFTDPGDTQYDKANVGYTYSKAYKDGVKVRLKVRDNNGAESVSDPVTVYVDSKANPPTAAFTSSQLDGKKIQFTSNSTADTANGANLKSYSWDFDVNTDSNGDGIKDNDVQSTDQSPVFEYPDYGIYRAKLTVTDDQGNSNSVANFVNVKAPTATTSTGAVAPLSARLLTTPATSVADGRIHLQGDSANVTFDFSTSTGNIVEYWLDKNIYYDSNGDGNPANDHDYDVKTPGTWTTTFSRSYGQDTVRLTVVDASGKTSTVDKQIVFDAAAALSPAYTRAKIAGAGGINTGGADSKNTSPRQLSAFVLAGYEVVNWQVMLVTMLGFGIFIVNTLNKKKHARNKSQQQSE